MNEASESGDEWEPPYLFGLDSEGRIVWMSERAKTELGPIENLAVDFAGRFRAGDSFRIWPVLVLRDALLIGAQAERGVRLKDPVRLEDRMVAHHLRLERAERALSARVKSHSSAKGKLIRQIELERQRLGRELHTSVGQLLAAIRLQLEVIAAQPYPGESVQRALDSIGRLAGDALEQVRGISRRLHPPEWQRLTLQTALRQMWEVSGFPQRFDAHLSLQALDFEPAQETKVLLYRAAQEALANIARHSDATRVEMTLEARAGTIALTVADNGHGFDEAAAAGEPAGIESGIGLRSLREEAADLGATLEVATGPDGTTLKVMAPYSTRG